MIVERLARISRLDLAMLALALFSVGLLLYVFLGDVSPQTQLTVFRIDLAVCAIFGIEFAWRWHRDGWSRRFLARNWYEILGMIPVAHPALRSFRLLRVVRVVVVLVRLGYAADRAFGEEFTIRLVRRFTDAIVEAIKRPITIAVLDEVSGVLRTGQYTRNLARALEENHDQLQAMVLEKFKEDPTTRRLAVLPFHDRMVATVSDTTLRVVQEVLQDPRTDELVSDILRENLEQIRIAVREEDSVTSRVARSMQKT